jgi:hypothetical protein
MSSPARGSHVGPSPIFARHLNAISTMRAIVA